MPNNVFDVNRFIFNGDTQYIYRYIDGLCSHWYSADDVKNWTKKIRINPPCEDRQFLLEFGK